MIARQGDVLVRKVDSIPKKAVKLPRENGQVVLAHGEATGHTHAFGSRLVSMYAVADEFTKLGSGFIEVKGNAAILRHQEHAPISFPPGKYQVTRQREYIEGELRTVAD